MYRFIRALTVLLICLSFLTSFDMGCVKRPFFKPRGKFIGSCKGVMELTPGRNKRFSFDLFQAPDGDLKIYFSLRSKGVRYAEVGDFSIEDDMIHVEIDSSGKEYSGKIAGDAIQFKGEWGKYKGSFMLNLTD